MKTVTPITGFALLALAAITQARSADVSLSASSQSRAMTGAPAPMSPNPSSHSMPATGPKDDTASATFVTQASQAGMAEVVLSKLALTRSGDAQVKGIASTMIQDHRKSIKTLKAIADKQGLVLSPLPDPEHAAMLRNLGSLSGPEFDQAYVQQMGIDHEMAIKLFERETTASNHELASFATKTLPNVKHHRELLRTLPNAQS